MLLTIIIQSITQYSLHKQSQYALLINLAGKQRMLGQKALSEFYECRLIKCNYSDMMLGLTRLMKTHVALQKGDAQLGLLPLEDRVIQKSFDLLITDINKINAIVKTPDSLENVSLKQLSNSVQRFVTGMDKIVSQFQKKAESDIRTLMIIELELASLSLIIILLEVIFIINPAVRKITEQNKKLKEIAWHQSHAFSSHIKNIKDLRHVLTIEKDLHHKQELIDCIGDELKQLEQISANMTNTLQDQTKK